MASSSDFDFYKLLRLFEKMSKCVQEGQGVPTKEWADAIESFVNLLNQFGIIFSFATDDAHKKIQTLREWAPSLPNQSACMEKDIACKNVPPNDNKLQNIGYCSPTRAFNRTYHICKFLVLMIEYASTCKESDLSLGVSDAYEQSFALFHSLIMRTTVRAAMTIMGSIDKNDFFQTYRMINVKPEEYTSFIRNSRVCLNCIEQDFKKRGIEINF